MDNDRKKLIDIYKKEQRAVRTRERLDAVVSLFVLAAVGVWVLSVGGVIAWVLWYLWVTGLGFISVGLAVYGLAVLVWLPLDYKNKKELEAARQRKLRANWRD